MSAIANDHIGIRVTDMERSVRFYVDAFEAKPLTRPFLISGELPEAMFEGPPGVSFRLCHLSFGEGMIELSEFRHPRTGAALIEGWRGNITHVGFVVEDVEATVGRVLAAGGTQMFATRSWGVNHLAYTRDPDGNVIEIADAPLSGLLAGTIAQFPEADPSGHAGEQ
jgi:catechol 2,3-dioxygenase-like lactoylglutathione lyase family enzyme